MNLKFCDRCGVRLTDSVKKYTLDIIDNNYMSDTYRCSVHTRDLCEQCKKDIERQCRYDEREVRV